MRRIFFFLAAGLAAAAPGGLAGCGGTYLRNRGNDALDVFTLGVERGSLIVGVKAGPAATGIGFVLLSDPMQGGPNGFGLLGRHAGTYHAGEREEIFRGRAVFWERAGGRPAYLRSQANAYLLDLCVVDRLRPGTAERPEWKAAGYRKSALTLGQFEAAVGIGGNLRIGVNALEILDFLAGWTGFDPAGDDRSRLWDALARAELPAVQAELDRDPRQARDRDDRGRTPLHGAAAEGWTEAAALILACRPDVNARDEVDFTPLHEAALNGRRDVAGLLLDYGAKPGAPDRSGLTPLHLAVLRGDARLAGLLLERGAEAGAFARPLDPTGYLAERGFRAPSNWGPQLGRDGHAPIHLAAMAGRRDLLETLAARGADLQTKTEPGYSAPIHLAAAFGSPEAVKFLLDRGVDKSSENKAGHTPIEEAAFMGRAENAALLVARGAGFPDKARRNFLLAYSAAQGRDAVVDLILARFGDVNEKDEAGMTPLHLAAAKAPKPGRPGAEMERSGLRRLVEKLIKKGADPNQRDAKERTPLHYAAEKGAASIVRALLDGGADPRFPDHTGRTPADLARENEFSDVAALLARPDPP